MKRFALVAVACAALAGCVSTSTTMLSGGPVLPPTADSAIAIYRTAAQVPGPYRELALLNSSGDASMTNVSQMYASMRTQAAKIGANAIILDSTTEPGAGAQVAAAIFGVSADRRGRAIAVLVEGLPVVPAPPKPAKN